MPSGPGVISLSTIAQVVQSVQARAETWLLTSKRSATEVLAQHRTCGTSHIQLTDTLVSTAEYSVLREALPTTRLVQVIHVVGPESLGTAEAAAPLVDALLLDSGNPQAQIKTLGGTGRTHDWSVSAEIVRAVSRPVFLAGGLRASNVASAIATVRPFGIDVCSGVRSAGRIDPDKVRDFALAAGVL